VTGQRLRRRTDHQIGFLVEEDGEQRIRLDRGTTKQSDQSTFPYKPGEWEPAPRVPLDPGQVARCLYDFDRAYRISRGNYSVPEWNSLREETKRVWGRPLECDDPFRVECNRLLREKLESA
jgi:hypothetical protein